MASMTIDLSAPIGDGSPEAASAELARLMAAAPKPDTDFVDVVADGQPSRRLVAAAEEGMRERGASADEIAQARGERPVSAWEHNLARLQLAARMSDPAFTPGFKAHEDEFERLTRILASPVMT
jgi:hypothetical protein